MPEALTSQGFAVSKVDNEVRSCMTPPFLVNWGRLIGELGGVLGLCGSEGTKNILGTSRNNLWEFNSPSRIMTEQTVLLN